MSGAIVRKSVVVTGWVQGVGFRWRAKTAAGALGVTGWVRNDFNGAVSMELQGTEEQIDALLAAVERGAYVNIESLRVKNLPTVENETGFSVLDDA